MSRSRARVPPALHGGGRFDLGVDPAHADRVVKRGDPVALAREARALRTLAGRDVAPDLLAASPGAIVSRLLDGRPRRLAGLDAARAEDLGRVLRRAHDTVRSSRASLPAERGRPASLAGYLSRRAAQAMAAAGREIGIGTRFLAPAHGTVAPFRLLHGDLVGENVVWTPSGPRLVDWEFSRRGDPAEDLAYLAELNALPRRALSAVLRGYADDAVAGRVDSWRPVVALEAGAWYRDNGEPERGATLMERARTLAERAGPLL